MYTYVHNITLHSIYIYITLHYTTLHYTTLHYITLHGYMDMWIHRYIDTCMHVYIYIYMWRSQHRQADVYRCMVIEHLESQELAATATLLVEAGLIGYIQYNRDGYISGWKY